MAGQPPHPLQPGEQRVGEDAGLGRANPHVGQPVDRPRGGVGGEKRPVDRADTRPDDEIGPDAEPEQALEHADLAGAEDAAAAEHEGHRPGAALPDRLETSSRPAGRPLERPVRRHPPSRELRSLVCRDSPSGRPEPTRRSGTTPGRPRGSAGSPPYPAAPTWCRSSRSERTSCSSSGSNRRTRPEQQAEAFGRALAVTHAAGAPAYGSPPDGWRGDGWLGPLSELLPLSLDPVPTWSEFYAHQRIEAVLAQGRRLGIYDDQATRPVREGGRPGRIRVSWTPANRRRGCTATSGPATSSGPPAAAYSSTRPRTAATARPTSRSSSSSAPRTSTRSSAGMRTSPRSRTAGGNASRCTSSTR